MLDARLLSRVLCLTLFIFGACATPYSDIRPKLPETYAAAHDQEYAAFTTQALTQNYIERKVRYWIQNHKGEYMRREIEYARHKHPDTFVQVMNDTSLCQFALDFLEVQQARQHQPDFFEFTQNFACRTPPPTDAFQVNTYTQFHQGKPTIAAAQDGSFAIAWQSLGQDSGDSAGIFAQRYQNDGTPVGSEFQVNTYTTSDQYLPAIAMAQDGSFVITWQSSDQDGDNSGIFAQRYNASGTPTGNEFQVNNYTAGNQSIPAIAMAQDGSFVITWYSSGQDGNSHGIFARKYSASGTPVGDEFQVNTYTTNAQVNPAIAMAQDGTFVIAWQSNGQDGDGTGIFAQRYNTNGTPTGNEFQVNTYTNHDQMYPAVAMAQDFTFVITWQSNGQDGDGNGIFAQRYNTNGTPTGNEFQVNALTTGSQLEPVIAMARDGAFVIGWHDSIVGQTARVFAQRYNANGAPIGDALQKAAAPFLQHPAVIVMQNGFFVMSWQSTQNNDIDIFAQGYPMNEEPYLNP